MDIRKYREYIKIEKNKKMNMYYKNEAERKEKLCLTFEKVQDYLKDDRGYDDIWYDFLDAELDEKMSDLLDYITEKYQINDPEVWRAERSWDFEYAFELIIKKYTNICKSDVLKMKKLSHKKYNLDEEHMKEYEKERERTKRICYDTTTEWHKALFKYSALSLREFLNYTLEEYDLNKEPASDFKTL